MTYRVFARKYRPQQFSELVGQAPIIQTLQNAITKNRLAQAYLFVGPRGVGKTSTARIFAKALNCVKGPTIHPCGTCDACLEIAEGRSLDVLEIDGASNNSVESIRTLRDNASFAPAQGAYKIYLIDEVHMLTTAAFNALLKTLEEPPPHVKFIFATTEVQKLPATIISRCQRFDLHRISEELIAQHLLEIATKEKITLAPEAAQALARGADGALRDAESMLDQVISFCGTNIQANDVQEVFGFTPSEVIHQLVAAIFRQETSIALALLLEQSNAGKDLSRLLTDFISFVRDLLVEKVSPSSKDSLLSELGAMVPTEKLLLLLEELGSAEGRLRWATNKKLQLDILIIKIIHLLQEISLSDVLDALSDLADAKPSSQELQSGVEVEIKKTPVVPTIEKTILIPPPSVIPITSVPAVEQITVTEETSSAFSLQPSVSPCEATLNIWTPVAEQLASESRLKFGWVASGKFLEQRGNKIVVEFPPSCEAQTETLFWPQARKKIQECLSKNSGMPMELVAQFTGEELPEELPHEIVEEKTTVPPPSQARAKSTSPKSVPSDPCAKAPLTAEALANFKHDPLIQQALEIFKAEVVMSV
jgi:DNA polymerase-3 subunit gamma/tau